MVKQKKVDLNEPIDEKAKPTLSKSELKPELSEAALTLHGDYYRQLQSKCNRYIFWHTRSIGLMMVILVCYSSYLMYDYVIISDSIREFTKLVLNNKFDFINIFPCLILTFSCIGTAGYFISDEFRGISDDLLKPNYIEEIFGFDLKKYSKLTNAKTPKETKFKLTNSKNSQLIIYRDSPIAVVTLKPLIENSIESNFFIKITGLNVRKVFQKVDFDTLLIETAILRSRELFQEYVDGKKIKDVDGCKINILIDAYSFDTDLIKTLTKNSFGLIKKDYNLNFFQANNDDKLLKLVSYKSVHQFFEISKNTYGLTLLAKNEDQDLILKTSKNYLNNDDQSTKKRR